MSYFELIITDYILNYKKIKLYSKKNCSFCYFYFLNLFGNKVVDGFKFNIWGFLTGVCLAFLF
jgi:hypothetical protein